MISTFEKAKLNQLLRDFYLAVGISISVFDDNFDLVTEYPENPPDICAAIRATKEGQAACRECDRAAFMRAKSLHKAHTYICHAGITEAIAPIQIDGGVLGYAIFAHLMPAENYEGTVNEICARLKKFGLEEGSVRAYVKKLKRYSNDRICAAMRILEIIASYMQISKMASWKNDNIAARICEFIDDNLASHLDSNVLCDHFFISRTKLYKISKQTFDMGIAQYITSRRIERAKELLKNSDMTVARIAEKTGGGDYNYFCKLFKKHVGTTPVGYRNS